MAKKRESGRRNRTVGRPRLRDGGTWIVLAARFEDELWTCSLYDEHEQPIGAAVHVRAERAMRAALEEALERGTPGAILFESGVNVAALGPLPAAIGRTGAEHAELIARFHDHVRSYEQIARDQDEPEMEEAAEFARFLDIASLLVTALESDRESQFTAQIAVDPAQVAYLWAGATPAIVVGSDDDREAIHEACNAGAAPPCASVGVVFHPADRLARGMVTSLRRTGWTHRVLPCMRVTSPDGAITPAGPRDMRLLTQTLDLLINAGLASAARGHLGAGIIEVTPRPGLRILWHLAAVPPDEHLAH